MQTTSNGMATADYDACTIVNINDLPEDFAYDEQVRLKALIEKIKSNSTLTDAQKTKLLKPEINNLLCINEQVAHLENLDPFLESLERYGNISKDARQGLRRVSRRNAMKNMKKITKSRQRELTRKQRQMYRARASFEDRALV
jgi:hypothetical protein